MLRMSNSPEDVQDQLQATMAAAPPVAAYMPPVDPHASLIAPIGPAPQPAPTMAAPKQGESKMAQAQKPIEDNLSMRLQKDYQKDADPYGSPDNHPGFFGKLLHGLNVATGGVNRRGYEEQGLENRIQGLAKNESEEGLQGAQTKRSLTEEQGDEIENANKPQQQEDTHQRFQDEHQASQDAITQGPTLANAYAHAVNEALKANRDPAADPVVQHLADAITNLQKPANTPPGTKTVQLEVGGKPHQVLVDERTGETIKDLGESGEKPPSFHVSVGEQRGEKNDVIKAYQPTLDSAERMNVMTESYEKAVKDHDQQAMLNLLANHLGMTMGLQKGARMTRDIVNEAKNSTPWLQGMEAKFDKDGYLSGVTLTQPQMRQMVALGQSRYAEDAKKSRATAQYLGAKDDGPERIPGKATMNYYLMQTNGDPGKAKALAAEDGWTVK